MPSTRATITTRSPEVPMAAAPDAHRDPRVAAFCSPEGPEVFHAVAHRHEIWRPDPFDVETIHDEARAAFRRLVHRATAPGGTTSGRVLLLQGEAGSGKTHLMRAFRNWAHARGLGYCGYMQMTSSTDHYGRYALNNLIDSLDQPYHEPNGETSGLMRLSTAVAEVPGEGGREALGRLREDELDDEGLTRLVIDLADRVVMDDRFNDVDHDLVRALIYLQRDDPRVKARVLKYLRCELLSPADRAVMGNISPRIYVDAPQRLIALLGGLIRAVDGASLVLCIDQLEDIYNFDNAEARFRRAMATACDLADRVPSSIVVISCLEDYYIQLRRCLTRPLIDRIEEDPRPILLKGSREVEEIERLVEFRLRHLYDALGVPSRDDEPTFPIPPAELAKLAGQRTRDVLNRCREFRERCIRAGDVVAIGDGAVDAPPPPPTVDLEQAWNDFRTGFREPIPAEDAELAGLLAWAIRACSEESADGHWFEAEADGWLVPVERHGPDDGVERLLVGLCNKAAQGGGLGRQVAEVARRAGEHTPVLARSTRFPSSPKAEVFRRIGELVAWGGRRVVVEDSDWRAMLAMRRFARDRANDPSYPAWLKEERPLARLKALRAILDLDRPRPPAIGPGPIEPPASPKPGETPQGPPPPGDDPAAVAVGVSADRAAARVTLDLKGLTQHAAFLGAPGSGKTTVALGIVEQLLLRGIPAILVDRKGDLCGFAREDAWTRPTDDPALADRRARLRERVEVALYTPGHPQGRPLSIAIVPPGLGDASTMERTQTARYAAAALAGMMNYGARGSDQSRLAILAHAIDLLGQLSPGGEVSLAELIRFIAEEDPALLNAVGRLDPKLFEKLVQDLETLRLNRGELLAAKGEPLDAEALLGLGRHATPGKTRLGVVSTKFLGGNQDVQFWVAQLLLEMARWASRSPSPSGDLQAVLLFDEADLYLPALRQPPTKEPMENLLKRARSAGLGLLLASQSPGDFDYKCRDNIRTWFVGRIKEQNSINKMKPMLSECRGNVAARLPGQEAGQFHLLRDGQAVALRADRSAIPAEQLPEDQILALARRRRPQ